MKNLIIGASYCALKKDGTMIVFSCEGSKYDNYDTSVVNLNNHEVKVSEIQNDITAYWQVSI